MPPKKSQMKLARAPFGPKLMSPEWKTSTTAVTSTPAANTPTSLNLTSSIAQGVGYNQRIGDGITVKEIELVVAVSNSAAATLFLAQPLICVDADLPASDMLLGTGPLNSVDRHTCQPLAAAWRASAVQAAEGGGVYSAVHHWTLRGNWPIRWDRTGDPTGPTIFLVFDASAATCQFDVVATVTYTDA